MKKLLLIITLISLFSSQVFAQDPIIERSYSIHNADINTVVDFIGRQPEYSRVAIMTLPEPINQITIKGPEVDVIRIEQYINQMESVAAPRNINLVFYMIMASSRTTQLADNPKIPTDIDKIVKETFVTYSNFTIINTVATTLAARNGIVRKPIDLNRTNAVNNSSTEVRDQQIDSICRSMEYIFTSGNIQLVGGNKSVEISDLKISVASGRFRNSVKSDMLFDNGVPTLIGSMSIDGTPNTLIFIAKAQIPK